MKPESPITIIFIALCLLSAGSWADDQPGRVTNFIGGHGPYMR